MIFASDNWAGASDRVIAAVAEAGRRGRPAYGGDPLSRSVEKRLADLFEHEVAVFFVGTGTAANALGLANYAKPGGVAFAHREAHVIVDEAGAASLFGGGLTLVGLDGESGCVRPDTLAAAIARYPEDNTHHGRPVALSLTQLTELGTAYEVLEIATLADLAHAAGLAVHMDGARFAAATAALGVAPADLTWRAGVDVLSLGGTKNGCFAAEAVIFFDPDHAQDFALARQRAGHGFSKSWFMAAQFEAWLEDDHWLDLARTANASAARLADAFRRSTRARLALPPAANEIFAVLPANLAVELRAAGVSFHPWTTVSLPPSVQVAPGESLYRFVASFATTEEEVERLGKMVA